MTSSDDWYVTWLYTGRWALYGCDVDTEIEWRWKALDRDFADSSLVSTARSRHSPHWALFPSDIFFRVSLLIYFLRLRFRSSCRCWGTERRVVSIGHDHWQHFWFRHECHCHWHPLLSCLPWTCLATSALALPHLLHPPSGVPSITRLAGHDVGRRSTCPMNLLRLVATMSCRSPTPALSRSSSFVIWSLHDTPIMSRRHLLLNTLSILFVLSVVLHVSLA